MLLAIATVTRHAKGDERDRVFLQALREANRKGVELLVFPGGYFRTSSVRGVCDKASVIASQAKRYKIAVAVGVDADPKKSSTKGTGKKVGKSSEERIKRQTLSSFVVSWSSESGKRYWRQRSTTSKDQKLAPDKACARTQEIKVSDRRAEILSCGEIFNERIKDAIVNRTPKVHLIVDVAHKGEKWRIDRTLKFFADREIPAFGASHVNRKDAMKRGFKKGTKLSTRATDHVIVGPPRIEMKFWRV